MAQKPKFTREDPIAPCGLCHGTGARPGALSSITLSRNPSASAGIDVRCARCEGRGVVNVPPSQRTLEGQRHI